MRNTRAFTLIEVLVTVAALSVIAVGIASIFGTVQKTITAGKSASVLTQYANQLERQIREDLENVSRDAFMVINHQQAEGGANVPLFEGLNANSRPRRMDQIVFFRNGEFASQRPALIPGVQARSTAAMVWIGHGQMRPVDANVTGPYRRPRVDDLNDSPNTRLGQAIAGNPNRYASQWRLLRKVTLLASPEIGQVTYPTGPGASALGLSAAAMRDNDIQHALQPAVSSVSRKLNEVIPATLPASYVRQGENARPRLSSGLVDIATTNLAEICAIVHGCAVPPGSINDLATLEANLAVKTFTGSATRLTVMQAWMHEAFPTNPSTNLRPRFEPIMPDFVGGVTTGTPVERAYRYADQMMLSSQILTPACTEFAVAWSFGQLNATGDLIWYDSTSAYGAAMPFQIAYERETPAAPGTTIKDFYDRWTVDPELIHGALSIGPSPSTFSYFGYVDPLFNSGAPVDQVTGAVLSAAKESSIPWAWPELIRVTVSLADANDPSVERTFRFVFDLPGEPGSN